MLTKQRSPVGSSGGPLCSFPNFVFQWLSLKSKRLFKSHYDLKGGWLLAFTLPPQAILFNISAVAVQENSTIFICYTFLPSAGKTIN